LKKEFSDVKFELQNFGQKIANREASRYREKQE